ncbi:hypothetical protein HY632_05450 [Candidatus Uhrbacteria bacterium]|nr:hypothetical protein [Candidatus Uhrbacteria bacterium]
MAFPYRKQLLTAGLIVVLAPSATIIAAHSIDQYRVTADFIVPPYLSGKCSNETECTAFCSEEQEECAELRTSWTKEGGATFRAAQEFGPPPGGGGGAPPGGGGQMGPPPGGSAGAPPGGGGPMGPPPGGGSSGSGGNFGGNPGGGNFGGGPGMMGNPGGPNFGGNPGGGPGSGGMMGPSGNTGGSNFGGKSPEGNTFGGNAFGSNGQGLNGTGSPNGQNALNGINGVNGMNGLNGINGVNGLNGVNGINGLNGVNGINGLNGMNGLNGSLPNAFGPQGNNMGPDATKSGTNVNAIIRNDPPGLIMKVPQGLAQIGEPGAVPPQEGMLGKDPKRMIDNDPSMLGGARPPQPGSNADGTNTRPSGGNDFESCVRSVVGDLSQIRGSSGPTEAQRRMVQEKCAPSQRPPTGPGMGVPPGMGSEGGANAEMSDEEQEARELQQKEQMLKAAKKQFKDLDSGLKRMTGALAICAKAKVEVPEEIADGIQSLRESLTKVQSATDVDAVQDVDFSDFADVGDRVKETVDYCQRIQEFPRISKQLGSELRRMESDLKRLVSQAARTQIDVSEELTAAGSTIAEIKSALAEAAKTPSEEALDRLHELRDNFDGIRGTMDAVRSVMDVGRGISDATKEVTKIQREITSLKRKRVDVKALESSLSDGKIVLAQIQGLAKKKPVDTDALLEAFEQLSEARSSLNEALQEARGQTPSSAFGKSDASAGLKLGAFDSFRKQSGNSGSSDLEKLFGL